MVGGFLVVETHPGHPGLVRIYTTTSTPRGEAALGGARLCYVARFDDPLAGQMHSHSLLRRQLVDADSGLYRTNPLAAVAAADCLDLAHRRVYVDPELAADPRLAEAISSHCARRRRAAGLWDGVGILALVLLLTRLLLGL